MEINCTIFFSRFYFQCRARRQNKVWIYSNTIDSYWLATWSTNKIWTTFKITKALNVRIDWLISAIVHPFSFTLRLRYTRDRWIFLFVWAIMEKWKINIYSPRKFAVNTISKSIRKIIAVKEPDKAKRVFTLHFWHEISLVSSKVTSN